MAPSSFRFRRKEEKGEKGERDINGRQLPSCPCLLSSSFYSLLGKRRRGRGEGRKGGRPSALAPSLSHTLSAAFKEKRKEGRKNADSDERPLSICFQLHFPLKGKKGKREKKKKGYRGQNDLRSIPHRNEPPLRSTLLPTSLHRKRGEGKRAV